MQRLRALTLVLLVLATLPASLRAQTPDSVQVKSLKFDGPRVIPDALLSTAIVSTQNTCQNTALTLLCLFGIGLDRQYVDARVLAADIVRLRLFYYQRGYRQATVTLDTTRSSNGMDVRFHIDAGTPVIASTVTYNGVDALTSTQNLPLQSGQPLSLIDYELTRDSLTTRLANRGFARAVVLANYEIPHDSPYVAHVSFEAAPGARARFGDIEVAGASRVSAVVVRRLLSFKPGDVYSEDALLRSQRSLFSLEIFRHAEIDTVTSVVDSIVPVRVQVNEGDLHRFRAGVGLNTAEFLNAEGRWTARNFMGGARHLEVRGRITNIATTPLRFLPLFENCESSLYCQLSGSLSADFEQPWFMGSRNTLGLGLFAERLTLPQVYVRTTRGASISVRRVLGGGGALQLAYRPELTRLESEGDVIFCVNFVACEPSEINQLRAPHWLAPVTLSYAVDKSNSVFDPTRGTIFRTDVEYAAPLIGSDFAYERVASELTHYSLIGRGVVLATRIRPGVARATDEEGDALGLHPQKRFFAGGPNSVRGYAQFRLGPKLLTIDAARNLLTGDNPCTPDQINFGTCSVDERARVSPGDFDVRPIGGAASLEGNAEVRFPLVGLLRGVAFMDFGQVWKTANQASFKDLAWSPGAGIRYSSPIGPIRIDVGYNTRGAEKITVVTTQVQTVVNDKGETTYQNTKTLQSLGSVIWNPYHSFTSRLQFHFSIGQAF